MLRMLGIISLGFLLACSESQDTGDLDVSDETEPKAMTAYVDEARIANIDTVEPGSWLSYGRNYEEQRFSPLTAINRETVSGLGLAWHKDLNSYHPMQGTPLVIDGVMYFSTAFNVVYAVNPGNGQEIWSYDPEVPKAEARRKACCGANARGIAAYKGNIYTATLDGRLIALDAASGRPVWEVDTIVDPTREFTITGAPRVASGKVFIGNGGAEFGVRGYVTAYDATTGEMAWRFYTVPGNPAEPFEHPEMELAADTWKGGEWWEIGGGGTVWNSIVYDPDFNSVYLGVGNGAPWTRIIRSPGGGDNLFLASIVALDADTGRMKWYYQTTPGDNWDYTAVQDMTLADLEIDGEKRKVLMQAPKNGFFYVIDRADGRLLRAHAFAAVTWATHVDLETGRPVENPDTEYLENPSWIFPGPGGAHNWHAMSWDAGRGLMYFGSHDTPFLYAMPEEYQKTGVYKRRAKQFNLGIEYAGLLDLIAESEAAPATGVYLNAYDPVTGEKKWVVEQQRDLGWSGGVLATAGNLVFQGTATGNLYAYDSDTGDIQWEKDLYSSMVAPPISYLHEGEQYVAIMTGAGGQALGSADWKYGSTGRLVAFKLGGNDELEIPTQIDRSVPELPPLTATADQLALGGKLFGEICQACHGPSPWSTFGGIPDLRLMSSETHDLWQPIVLGGLRREAGRDTFADLLSMEDSELIHQFIISRAMALREEMASR